MCRSDYLGQKMLGGINATKVPLVMYSNTLYTFNVFTKSITQNIVFMLFV